LVIAGPMSRIGAEAEFGRQAIYIDVHRLNMLGSAFMARTRLLTADSSAGQSRFAKRPGDLRSPGVR